MNRSWILVGMMGAGKSSLGRTLAELTGRTFIDTDFVLQQRLGRPIPQIFQIYGESAFRDHETSVIKGLEPSDSIISTGGGAVLRSENWDEFRRLGTTVYLEASLNTLLGRLAVSKKKRPLLQVDDWEERTQALLESRIELYSQADIIFPVDDLDIHDAAERAIRVITEYESHRNQT